MKNKLKKFFLTIAVFLVLLTILKSCIPETFKIDGTSMEPGLVKGDRVWMNRLSYGFSVFFLDHLLLQWQEPQVGDIVIYRMNGHYVIKRCVAVAGTSLEYSAKDGYNLIVGEKTYPLSETQYHHMFLSKAVPKGMVLCIGDNYKSSIDSRTYGFVSTKDIIGKIINR